MLTATPSSELELQNARLFARGDVAAFEWLFRRHQQEVFRWVMRMVGDRALAEELTLDVFHRAWRSHASFDATRSIGPWLRRISARIALDSLRRHCPQIEPLDAESTAGPHDQRVQLQRRHALTQAFARLPAKLQLTARLALVEEMPYEEIAAVLDVSIAAVKTRVFRAVRQLRKELSPP